MVYPCMCATGKLNNEPACNETARRRKSDAIRKDPHSLLKWLQFHAVGSTERAEQLVSALIKTLSAEAQGRIASHLDKQCTEIAKTHASMMGRAAGKIDLLKRQSQFEEQRLLYRFAMTLFARARIFFHKNIGAR